MGFGGLAALEFCLAVHFWGGGIRNTAMMRFGGELLDMKDVVVEG